MRSGNLVEVPSPRDFGEEAIVPVDVLDDFDPYCGVERLNVEWQAPVARHGAEVAFPTQTLHIEPGETPVQA